MMITFLKWTETILHDEIASWGHLSMVICALGSVANIFYAFQSMEHGIIPSAILAVGLGIGLALSAIMASTIPMKQRGRFAFGLMATLFVATMSGAIQTAGYLTHDIGIYWALVFGFGLPIATELVLAIDLANKHDADKQQTLDNAESILELRVSEAIAESLADLDVSKSRRYVERQIDTILRAKAQQLVNKMISDNTGNDFIGSTHQLPDMHARANTLPSNYAESETMQTPCAEPHADPSDTSTIERVNRQKRENADHRHTALLRLLDTEYKGTPVEQLNKSALAAKLGVSARTIGRDLKWLEESGQISRNDVKQR